MTDLTKEQELQKIAELPETEEKYNLLKAYINEYEDFTAYIFLGYTCVNIEKYDEARLYYELFIEKNPTNKELLAIAYNNLANLLQNVYTEYKLAQQYYEKAIELNPEFADAYNNLAGLYQLNSIKKFDLAKINLEKAIKINNNYRYYSNLAFLLSNDYFKEFALARKYFEKSIRLNSNYSEAYFNFALLLENDYFKEYDLAKKYYEKAIELNPDYLSANNNLANLLQKDYFKEYESSKKIYEKSLEIHPNDVITCYNYANLLKIEYFKKYDSARKYFEKAIELNPEFTDAYNNLANLLANDNFKEYDLARKYYEKAIDLNPDYADAYLNLAIILQNDYFKEYDLARKYYEKAIELNPDYADAYNNLSNLLKNYFKEYDLAKFFFKVYEKALDFQNLHLKYLILYNNQFSLSEIFKLNNEEFTIRLFENILTIQNEDVIGFVKKSVETNNNGFIINLFGKHESQLKTLNFLRTQIETSIKTNEFNFVSLEQNKENQKNCTRFFYYENNFIDFEKLIETKFLAKNIFATPTGTEIPVENLLKYIGAENEKPDVEWKGSQFITQIEIENFKIFSKIKANFAPDINILVGRNGLGKTSFLQALTLGLLPSNNEDKSNEFDKYIHLNSSKSDIVLKWENEKKTVYVFKNELRNANYVALPQKLLLAYGVNLNTEEKLSHSEIIDQLIKGNGLPYSTKSIFKDYSKDFYDPIILLERLFLEKRGKRNKLIDSIIRVVFDTLNSYLQLFSQPENIRLESDYADFYYVDFNNNKLKTNNLSEGYKDFILQITDIVVKIIASRNASFEQEEMEISAKLLKQVKGLIVIDEFDRHLHPELQRRFLTQLKDDFQNIQFILSTHNIFSVQSAEGNTALIIHASQGKLEITTQEIKKGLSIESIYNLFFEGNSSFFGYETELLLKTFKNYIDKQRKEELTTKEEKEFKNTTKKLLEYSQEIQATVTREIRQFERLTGKTVKL